MEVPLPLENPSLKFQNLHLLSDFDEILYEASLFHC